MCNLYKDIATKFRVALAKLLSFTKDQKGNYDKLRKSFIGSRQNRIQMSFTIAFVPLPLKGEVSQFFKFFSIIFTFSSTVLGFFFSKNRNVKRLNVFHLTLLRFSCAALSLLENSLEIKQLILTRKMIKIR